MPSTWMIILAGGVIMPALFAQTGRGGGGTKAEADWPMYNRDLAGTRYSPLTQINTSNVSALTQAWSYRLQPEGRTLTSPVLMKSFKKSRRLS